MPKSVSWGRPLMNGDLKSAPVTDIPIVLFLEE